MPWLVRDWATGEFVNEAMMDQVSTNFTLVGPNITRARTTADVTNSTTTLANLTGISFAIGASEIWSVGLHGVAQVDQTGDYKSNWTVPAGATGHHWASGNNLGSQRADFTTVAILGSAATTEYAIDEYATVVNSTTAGTVQFQFALFSASGSNTWRANAFMIAWRLA